jgi:hypothetical protein
MRTTLNIDDDVLERARALSAKLHSPFKKVINEALRAGLEQVEKPANQRPYVTKPRPMGLSSSVDLNNIQELLAELEGEDAR